jgi:glycosyltransferase involved in cell wall biosynthesis
VIHPPVDVAALAPSPPRKNHFLAASRLVPYKNIAAIVEAFRSMPDLELVVAGDGPEAARLRELAGPNVSFRGFVSDQELRELMATARAFVFAAEDDFGIVPVEAQAEGTPVLALGRGGVQETVIANGPGRTGMFFETPDARAIAACVQEFIADEASFSRSACRDQARRFSAERFRAEFTAFAERELAEARSKRDAARASVRRHGFYAEAG